MPKKQKNKESTQAQLLRLLGFGKAKGAGKALADRPAQLKKRMKKFML